MTYFNWADGEPNNANGQHCVTIGGFQNEKWDDDGCSKEHAFVCETRQCPVEWVFISGKCYKAVTQKASWYDAKDKCLEMDGILAEPKSSIENTAVASLITDQFVWIGLNDQKIEAT